MARFASSNDRDYPTCRLTSCIRPHHLELVTCGENKRRAWLYQEAGDSLSCGSCNDEGEHVPEAWAEVSPPSAAKFQLPVPKTLVELPLNLATRTYAEQRGLQNLPLYFFSVTNGLRHRSLAQRPSRSRSA